MSCIYKVRMLGYLGLYTFSAEAKEKGRNMSIFILDAVLYLKKAHKYDRDMQSDAFCAITES